MHFSYPVPQTVQNKGLHNRVITVHGVAAAGVVAVITRVIFQYIIDGIIQAAERKGRSEFTPLRCVIEYDVEDYFDAVFMQLAHHPLELEYGINSFTT